MKSFIVLVSVILVARGGNIARLNRQNGWSSTTTPAPTTGWPAPVAPGWSAPINTGINLVADATNIGSYGYGYAGEDHTENVATSGDDVIPADIASVSGGDATISQIIDFSQSSNTNGDGSATSSNQALIDQSAIGTEGAIINSSGLIINAQQAGESVGLLVGQIESTASASSTMNIGDSNNSNLVVG